MHSRKASADKLNLVPVAVQPPQKWWMGIVTIGFFLLVGISLAIGVRAGMTFGYDSSPHMINVVFEYIGFPGRFVQMAIADKTHVASEEMRQLARFSCTAVNAVVYTVLLLLWFLRPNDNRQKKEHRVAKLTTRRTGPD